MFSMGPGASRKDPHTLLRKINPAPVQERKGKISFRPDKDPFRPLFLR